MFQVDDLGEQSTDVRHLVHTRISGFTVGYCVCCIILFSGITKGQYCTTVQLQLCGLH